MTHLSLESITILLGIVTSVGGVIAGIFRFPAWWFDRVKQSRIDSATHFRDHGKDEWAVRFGNEQLRRLHFRVLTGIDRTSGHEALRRCQQRLGGTDSEWKLLKSVGGFLNVERHTARVRKPGWWVVIGFSVSALFSFAMAFAALVIAGMLAVEFEKTPASAVHMPQVLRFFVASVWGTALAFGSVLAGSVCFQIINAFKLHRRLLSLATARRTSRLRKVELQIRDVTQAKAVLLRAPATAAVEPVT